MGMRIKINRVRCKFCKDVIESKHYHDFVTCSCGNVSVDGGREYIRRLFPAGRKMEDCIEELSEYDYSDNEEIICGQ